MLMMSASMMQQSDSRTSIREEMDDPWKLLEDSWMTCLLPKDLCDLIRKRLASFFLAFNKK